MWNSAYSLGPRIRLLSPTFSGRVVSISSGDACFGRTNSWSFAASLLTWWLDLLIRAPVLAGDTEASGHQAHIQSPAGRCTAESTGIPQLYTLRDFAREGMTSTRKFRSVTRCGLRGTGVLPSKKQIAVRSLAWIMTHPVARPFKRLALETTLEIKTFMSMSRFAVGAGMCSAPFPLSKLLPHSTMLCSGNGGHEAAQLPADPAWRETTFMSLATLCLTAPISGPVPVSLAKQADPTNNQRA